MGISTIFRKTNGELNTLFDQIDRGELGLPELQRPFVWGNNKVRDLFDSMYRGYPVGYFLFWVNDFDSDFKVKQIGENNKDSSVPRSLIIDGQQRLTAMYSVVKNRSVINKHFKKDKIKISFNPIIEVFKVANAATSKNKEYIEDISEVFEKSSYTYVNEYFEQLEKYKDNVERNKKRILKKLQNAKKLNSKDIEFIITRFNQLTENFESHELVITKLRDRIELSTDEMAIVIGILNGEHKYDHDTIANNIERLSSLKSYPYDALEINSEVEEEVVAEIFTRINSKGTILNQADFVLTLLSVFWDEGRKEINDYCESFKKIPSSKTTSSPYNHICDLDAQDVVRVNVGIGFKRGRMKDAYAILKGRDLATRKYNEKLREKQFDVFQAKQKVVLDNTNWHTFLRILIRLGFKSKELVSSKNAIIYTYIFYLLGKTEYKIDHKGLDRIIAKWFFMANLTSRYSSSPESQMESDLNRIKECKNGKDFIEFIEQATKGVLTNDFWNISLPKDFLVTSSAKSPAGNTFFACQISNSEKVLFSDRFIGDLFDPTLKLKKKVLERHHVFPANFLKKGGVKQTERNQIANMVYLEFQDNIKISDDSPEKYFIEVKNKYYKGKENQLDKMLVAHCIPNKFYEMDYKAFLDARRILIANYIRRTFEGI